MFVISESSLYPGFIIERYNSMYDGVCMVHTCESGVESIVWIAVPTPLVMVAANISDCCFVMSFVSII